jgi:guanosine-3',5'-bis(diphosphate) 3'-pyrophosphohydrolase
MSSLDKTGSGEADWQRAVAYATRAHLGQFRKDGRTPYIAHPMRVCLILREIFNINDPVAMCAALLHDAIEETNVDFDDLVAEFGLEVAQSVAALSKDARLPETDRELAYDEQLRLGPWQARAVRLADTYDNIQDSLDHLMRRKAVAKARRALALVADDTYLAAAAAALLYLVQQHEV